MELALNLAWFIIASVSYALLGWRLTTGATEHPSGPSRFQCILALSCALTILFPVISLTDDLHEMQATLEEASPSRLIVKRAGIRNLSTPEPTSDQLPFVISSFVMGVSWIFLGGMPTQPTALASPSRQESPGGRAPPLFTVPQFA